MSGRPYRAPGDGARADADSCTSTAWGPADLFILEPDGGRMRWTADDAVEADPSWSPDGTSVLYSVRTPNRGIRIMGLLGR